MSDFPRSEIEGLSLPRLIMGTNWFLGYSHQSVAKDRHIQATMTRQHMTDTIEVFMRSGVDAIYGIHPAATDLLNAIKDAEDRTGRKCTRIAIPAFNIEPGEDALSETARVLDTHAAIGTDLLMPHQCTTDALVDRRSRTIRDMSQYMVMIRERGMTPGLSTHMPETIPYADEMGLDCATYIQIYNAAGFMMQVEVDWVHRIIWEAKKPVITIKPLAAGHLHPIVGLAFVWATLREQDMVTIGTLTPREAEEVVETSLSLLEHRKVDLTLQRTRSKQSIDGQEPFRVPAGTH